MADKSGEINIKDNLQWSGTLKLTAPTIILSEAAIESNSSASSLSISAEQPLVPAVENNIGEISANSNIPYPSGYLMFNHNNTLSVYVTGDVVLPELKAETIEIINIDGENSTEEQHNNLSSNFLLTTNNISLENNIMVNGDEIIVTSDEVFIKNIVSNEINVLDSIVNAISGAGDIIDF